MKVNQKNLIIYSLLIVIIWSATIFFSSSLPNPTSSKYDILIVAEKLSYLLSFGLLFLLTYNSLLMIFRYQVSRLAQWRTLEEKFEDKEFTKLIEFLLMIIAFLFSIIISLIDTFVRWRYFSKDIDYRDILINVFGIFLFAFTSITIPNLDKLEAMISKRKK